MKCKVCRKTTKHTFTVNVYEEYAVKTIHVCENCLTKLSVLESLGEITFTILRSDTE